MGGVQYPMLFLQGTRDKLAKTELIKTVCARYDSAKLKLLQGADHSFKTLKSLGVTQSEMIKLLAISTLDFMERHAKIME